MCTKALQLPQTGQQPVELLLRHPAAHMTEHPVQAHAPRHAHHRALQHAGEFFVENAHSGRIAQKLAHCDIAVSQVQTTTSITQCMHAVMRGQYRAYKWDRPKAALNL